MRPRAARHARVAASLLCAAALGALLFSVQVATMVFREMPEDRFRAGRVAGHAFVGAYGITAFASLIAFVVAWAARGTTRERIVSTALLVLASIELFWIAPAIVNHGSGWPGTFASLHATGGAVHLVLAVLTLVLAWLLLDDGPRAG